MIFEPQKIFAYLTEKERVTGHHSPEGRTIRMLGRALNGWSVGDLNENDVAVLCDQAMADWLKARLKLSQWSERSLSQLLEQVAVEDLLTQTEIARLRQIHELRDKKTSAARSVADVETALLSCIEIVDKYWS